MNIMAKEPVDICYYSSDFYAPYTGISMYSLCKNNPNLNFRLNCIDTGISEENKRRMRQVADKFGKELIFHDFSRLEAFIRDELKLPLCSGSYATYIKVFPDRIFKDADRLLFMDGDTIINGSIEPLLNVDLEPYVFAATKVSLINEKHVYTDQPPSLRLQYSLMFQNTGYYNIGVFYANLKRWKEVDFGSQIMAMREQHLERMAQAPDVPIDEMLINLAALEHLDENYVLPVPAIYNSTVHNIPHYRGLKANLCCGYISKAEFNQAYYHPVIIHYCIFKPWYTDTFSPHRGILNRYIAESPWPDAFTDKMYKTIPEKFFGRFVYRMPFEWLMMLVIWFGHLFLRTRGRLMNARNRRNAQRIMSMVQWENRGPVLRSLPFWLQALIRRSRALLTGDFRTAFLRSGNRFGKFAAEKERELLPGWQDHAQLYSFASQCDELVEAFEFHSEDSGTYADCVMGLRGVNCASQKVYVEFEDGDGRFLACRMETVMRADWAEQMGEGLFLFGGAGTHLSYEELPTGAYKARLYREGESTLLHSGKEWQVFVS